MIEICGMVSMKDLKIVFNVPIQIEKLFYGLKPKYSMWKF